MKYIKFTIALITMVLITSTSYAAGDAAAGKAAYVTCGACHGAKGEGNRAMNAPKLAGQEAWYVLSSLKRFKSGARGANDPIAMAMVPMAKMLTEKQMEDVAAYIESL